MKTVPFEGKSALAVRLVIFGRASLWQAVRPQLALVIGAGSCMASYVLCWFLGIESIGEASREAAN